MKGIERERVGPLPIWAWATLSGVLVWALYVFTLAPTTGFWDTSEYIATAHILGLPHPPGNPFFVVFGRVWELLLGWTGLTVAKRINLLSATMSAGAAVFWFLALTRIGARFWEDRRHVVVSALVAVLVGGTAFTVWAQSNLNEKVYTVSLFVVALVSYLAMVWEDEADTTRGDRLLLLMALLLGLGAANHTMSLLPLPALGLFMLWHRWRAVLRPGLLGAAALLFGIGFTVQTVFVPIRSADEPVIDEADPECASLVSALITPLEVAPVTRALVPDGVVCEP
ncbi:MAG: glycosyltransferase family 117 protein, partial [Gemmatimonadota bacterium]